MKSKRKLFFIILMVISIAAMFLPVIEFPDISLVAGYEDIVSQEGKVDSAATQLQRWIDGGKKKPSEIQKQRDKVQQEQDKADKLEATLVETINNDPQIDAEEALARYEELKAAKAKLADMSVWEEVTEESLQAQKDAVEAEKAALEELKAQEGAAEDDILAQESKVLAAEDRLAKMTGWIEYTVAEADIETQKETVAADIKAFEDMLKRDGPKMALLPATLHRTAFGIELDEKEAAQKALADELAALKQNGASEEELAAKEAEVTAGQEELDAYKEENKLKDANSTLLPELEIDVAVLNQYKLYKANFDLFCYVVWGAAGCLVLALVLVLLAGGKLKSKLFTLSSFLHLIGILLLAYSIIRIGSFPIKRPYAGADVPLWATLLMLIPAIAAFALHVSYIRESKRSMIYVFCTFLSLLAIVPFWIMIVNATRSSQAIQQGVSIIPGTYLQYNWNVLQSKNFDVSVGFMNSAIIAFASTILSVFFSAMTAYGFKVYQFKGRAFLYAVVMAIIMIPTQVTGTGFFMFMYQLRMVNNRLALIIPSIAAAGTVFFFRQYLEANLQLSLVEAARIDGCGEFRTFCRIIVPIMLPAMATMGIMAVIGSWNNYLTPLMLFTDPGLKTLPMMVQELRGDIYRTEYGSIYLGLTMTALPLIIVYFALSKFIIAGVALGGVKE